MPIPFLWLSLSQPVRKKLPQLVYSVWAKLQADKRFSSMFVQLNMSKGSITLLFTIWGAKKFRAWQIVEVYPG